MTFVETQRLQLTVICWLTCHQEETISYVTADTGSIPSKLNVPECLKHIKSLDDEHKKKSLPSKCANHFPTSAKNISFSIVQKSLSGLFAECLSNLLKGELNALKGMTWQNFKASSDYCFQNEQIGSKGETFWRPKNERAILEFKFNKSLNTRSVTKQELPKHQNLLYLTNQNDSLKKHINKRNIAKADSLLDTNLCCPHIRLSSSQTIILDAEETGFLNSGFAQQMLCKNADVPDIHFILFDVAGISPTLIQKQNAKAEERGSCVSFKM